MSDSENTGERFMRFHAMYREVLDKEFDALEFAEDDFYAFQVLDRAFRCDNQELRNLAAHLQMQREQDLETITIKATEILESTRRLKTLELKLLEDRGENAAPDAIPDKPPPAARTESAPPEPPTAAPDPARRRKGWFR